MKTDTNLKPSSDSRRQLTSHNGLCLAEIWFRDEYLKKYLIVYDSTLSAPQKYILPFVVETFVC